MSENHDTSSNDQTSPIPAVDPVAWAEKDREHTRRAHELLATNKATLFDALAGAGITTVSVHFDGYGDEGQVDDVWAHTNDAPVELPEDRIEMLDSIWGSVEVERQTMTIREAVEAMAWNLLRETHGHWEDNEGGFGDFLFNVAERTIRLDYNERISDTEFYQHEF